MEEGAAFVRVYKYRWIILFIFCLYSGVNFLQMFQYTIIANITTKYYDVDSSLVDLSSLLFMVCFIVFCLPVNHLIEKYNLKVTALISSGLTAFGCLIKLFSAPRDRFGFVLVGQFFCAVSQVFMFSVPPKLANTWFGPAEVSTACALALLGGQVGISVGCIFSSTVVKSSDDLDAIGYNFLVMVIFNAAVATAVFLLVFICFRAKPAVPPSQSQVNIIGTEQPSTLEILKAMVNNKDYLLILVAIGSSNGVYTTFGIVVNNVYLHYFPGYEVELGITVAFAVLAGSCIGLVFFGYILDKYHQFKITTLFVIFGATITYILFVLSLELQSQLATYFTIPLLVLFLASTLIVGFEFATEVMYPLPEAATVGILNSVIYIFAIIYTLSFENLIDVVGYFPTETFLLVVLTVSAAVAHFITPNLKRREANLTD